MSYNLKNYLFGYLQLKYSILQLNFKLIFYIKVCNVNISTNY